MQCVLCLIGHLNTQTTAPITNAHQFRENALSQLPPYWGVLTGFKKLRLMCRNASKALSNFPRTAFLTLSNLLEILMIFVVNSVSSRSLTIKKYKTRNIFCIFVVNFHAQISEKNNQDIRGRFKIILNIRISLDKRVDF